MAGKDNQAEDVEIDGEDVVEIDISDKPELAAEAEKDGKQPVKRIKLSDAAEAEEEFEKPAKEAVEETSEDDAAAALREAAENARKAQAAAEATALAERQRAEQAERLAAQRGQEAREARESVAERELAGVESSIEATKQNIENLEGELARAYESGEFTKAAQVQSKLSRAAASLDRLEASKTDLEARRDAEPTAEGAVEVPQTTQQSPFEQFLSQGGFTPQAQTWLRAHPECAPAQVGGDVQANARMMQGHYAAVQQGIQLNSPEYFRVIEEHTGHRKVETKDDPKPAPKAANQLAPKQAKAMPSAPASREPPSASTGIPQGKRSVTLTPQQQEAAIMSFPSLPRKEALATYARNLVELQAEGKIGRTTH